MFPFQHWTELKMSSALVCMSFITLFSSRELANSRAHALIFSTAPFDHSTLTAMFLDTLSWLCLSFHRAWTCPLKTKLLQPSLLIRLYTWLSVTPYIPPTSLPVAVNSAI